MTEHKDTCTCARCMARDAAWELERAVGKARKEERERVLQEVLGEAQEMSWGKYPVSFYDHTQALVEALRTGKRYGEQSDD